MKYDKKRWETNTSHMDKTGWVKQEDKLAISRSMQSTGDLQEHHRSTFNGMRIWARTRSADSRRCAYTATHRGNTRRRIHRTRGKCLNTTYANYASALGNLPNGTKNRSREQREQKRYESVNRAGEFDNSSQEWPNYKNKLWEATQQIYPLGKKQTHTEEPEWVEKLAKWGTGQEMRQLD